MSGTDLTPADLFRSFADCRTCLLAVSGGPDSMALAHLARDWSRTGGAALHVATVDHGLRPESAAEAEQVGQWCASLGLPHHRLRWAGPVPHSRIQERARDARYDLLFGLAHELGAEAVLTGHHADDQAETVLLRLTRGSGPAGLAGMAPVSWRQGLRLGRPLLGLRKAALVDLCHARGQAYVEDPSNRDPKYARARLRRLMALLASEGLEIEDLLRLGARAARVEAALQATADQLFADLVLQSGPDTTTWDLGRLRTQPLEFLLRFLSRELGRHGTSAPRLERAERVAERLHAALQDGHAVKTTLAGCLIVLTPGGTLRLSPEPPRQRGCARSNPVHVTV